MAKIRRGGGIYGPSDRASLPPAQEYVHRLTELDTGRSRTVSDVVKGVWGYAPISAPTRLLQRFVRVWANAPPPYRRGLRPTRPYAILNKLRIRIPARVRFCQRRKERREVLFAFNRAGFSGSAPKRHYRRTQDSQYRC